MIVKVAYPTTYMDTSIHVVYEDPETKAVLLFKAEMNFLFASELTPLKQLEKFLGIGPVDFQECGDWDNVRFEQNGKWFVPHPFVDGGLLETDPPKIRVVLTKNEIDSLVSGLLKAINQHTLSGEFLTCLLTDKVIYEYYEFIQQQTGLDHDEIFEYSNKKLQEIKNDSTD